MRPSESLQLHMEEVREIFRNAEKQYGIINPKIIGSVRRGEDTENSDIDIVVQFKDTYPDTVKRIKVAGELHGLLGCFVQVVDESALSQEFAEEIQKSIPLL